MSACRLLIVLAGLVVAATLAGCGSHATTATAESISKAEFISKADEICAKGARDTQAISTDTPVDEGLHQTREIISGAVDDLEALDRPTGGARQINEWLRVLHQEVVLLTKSEKAANENDRAKLLALFIKDRKLEDRSQRLARRFGFGACAN